MNWIGDKLPPTKVVYMPEWKPWSNAYEVLDDRILCLKKNGLRQMPPFWCFLYPFWWYKI